MGRDLEEVRERVLNRSEAEARASAKATVQHEASSWRDSHKRAIGL